MLDQRGTGRSTPVGALPGLSAAEQAEYLKHFRADSIVRDAEAIRAELGVERWSVLGQSFGGFCVMTYLSIAPEGLREAFVTGGLAPVGRPRRRGLSRDLRADPGAQPALLRALPGGPRARARARRAARRGAADPADRRPPHRPALPPGGQQAGDERRRRGSARAGRAPARLAGLPPRRAGPPRLRAQPDLRDPARGLAMPTASPRAGRRSGSCRPSTPTRPSCSPASTSTPGCSRTTARSRRCARRPSCSPRTSGRGSTTPSGSRANEVPVAAAVYADDPYVERAFSEETAALIRGARAWVTNEYEHNGLRADGDRILGRLIDLARGRA